MTSDRAMRVVIQGERGSFSHQAALQALGLDIDVVPRPAFEDLFALGDRGQADRALVPIENSLAGSIHENYDRCARAHYTSWPRRSSAFATASSAGRARPWPRSGGWRRIRSRWPSAATSSPSTPTSSRWPPTTPRAA